MPDPHQKYRLPHGIGHVVRRHHRLRGSGEARELVHHALDVVHLPHDRVGALLEDVAVLDNAFSIFPAQTLGGKLNGRERIFDLMRDTAGDVGPGRGPLSGNEFSDVVEGNHIAVVGCRLLLAGDADRQIAFLTVAADGHLPLPLRRRCARRRAYPQAPAALRPAACRALRFPRDRSAARPSG